MSFYPNLSSHKILKQNMLEVLRDYPREYLQVLYNEYGDGVISGFNISVDCVTKEIRIGAGIVKQSECIYFLSHEEVLPYDNQSDDTYYCYLTITKNICADGYEENVNIRMTTENDSGKMELFRFHTDAGAVLRLYNRECINNCEVDKALINVIDNRYCPHGVIGGTTLCDNIYMAYADKILTAGNANPHDIAFAYQCLNGITNIKVVQSYFKQCEDMSNIALWQEMKNKKFIAHQETVIEEEPPKKDRRVYIG